MRRRKEITLKKWPDWRKINNGKSNGYGTTDLSFCLAVVLFAIPLSFILVDLFDVWWLLGD